MRNPSRSIVLCLALVAATAYSSATGFGWTGSTTGLSERDRGAPAPVRQDLVTSLNPATLRLTVGPGAYVIWVLRGDNDFPAERLLVDVDGVQVVSGGVPVNAGQWAWQRLPVDGGAGGRTVDVTFSNDAGTYWRINAVIVQ